LFIFVKAGLGSSPFLEAAKRQAVKKLHIQYNFAYLKAYKLILSQGIF
jgi:hypothetical protein